MSDNAEASAQDQLASLQALTDTAITALDVDDLLDELLSRVQEALDADTAAVLLLAKGGMELVATAARGIEEEVREGVRVPIGSGFAGRVAASRRPVRLERVDSTTVTNPILWEKGIKVMLGIPLLTADRVLGVIHVGDRRTSTSIRRNRRSCRRPVTRVPAMSLTAAARSLTSARRCRRR